MIQQRAILLAICSLAMLALSCRGAGQQQQPGAPGTTAVGRGAFIVSYASDSADTFATVGSDSILVLGWLRRACDSAKVKLDVKDFPFGSLVTGIGPRVNGDGGNWLYKVNGKMMAKAASACLVSPADTVLFFFE